MLNKLFREFKDQRSRFTRRTQINDQQSKKLKTFEKKPDLLRYRLLRTYLKGKEEVQEKNKKKESKSKTNAHNFELSELEKALELHDAIKPSKITCHIGGYYVLMFASGIQATAFKEAFEKGILVGKTRVYFSWMAWQQMKPALQDLKRDLNQQRRVKKKQSKKKVSSQFSRSIEDTETLGGLLLPRSPCITKVNEVLNDNWYKNAESEKKRKKKEKKNENENENEKENKNEDKDKDEDQDENMNENEKEKEENEKEKEPESQLSGGEFSLVRFETEIDIDAMFDALTSNTKAQFENASEYGAKMVSLNCQLLEWFTSTCIQSTERYAFVTGGIVQHLRQLTTVIQKTLALPNYACANMNRLLCVHGSLGYGLFINDHTEDDHDEVDAMMTTAYYYNEFKDKKDRRNYRAKISTKSDVNIGILLNISPTNVVKQNLFMNLLAHKIISTEATYLKQWFELIKDPAFRATLDENELRCERKRFVLIDSRLAPDDKKQSMTDSIVLNPQLKVVMPQLKVNATISIANESMTTGLTKLIKSYVTYDTFGHRIRPLLMAIKYWARRRKILGRPCVHLNGLAWVVLGIYYLQRLDTPLLPIMKIDVASGSILIKHKVDPSTCKWTVSELLLGFFQYYLEFPFQQLQICITKEEDMPRNDSQFYDRDMKYPGPWLIEHPTLEQLNIAKYFQYSSLNIVHTELNRAVKMMLDGSTWKDIVAVREIVQQSIPFDPKMEYNCLLFSNIRYDVTEDELRKLISKVAIPLSLHFVTVSEKKHNGKAYALFDTPNEAHLVRAEYLNTLIRGKPLIISFVTRDALDESIKAKETKTKKFTHLNQLKKAKETNTKASLKTNLDVSFRLTKQLSALEKKSKVESKRKQRFQKHVPQKGDITTKKKRLTSFLGAMTPKPVVDDHAKERMDEDKTYLGGVLID